MGKLSNEASPATCVGNVTVATSEEDVGKALVLYQRSVMPFSVFCARVESSRGKLELDIKGEKSPNTRAWSVTGWPETCCSTGRDSSCISYNGTYFTHYLMNYNTTW